MALMSAMISVSTISIFFFRQVFRHTVLDEMGYDIVDDDVLPSPTPQPVFPQSFPGKPVPLSLPLPRPSAPVCVASSGRPCFCGCPQPPWEGCKATPQKALSCSTSAPPR